MVGIGKVFLEFALDKVASKGFLAVSSLGVKVSEKAECSHRTRISEALRGTTVTRIGVNVIRKVVEDTDYTPA